ncbi:MAG: hypothetical protein ABJC09_06080 [Terriglobia bacterium]
MIRATAAWSSHGLRRRDWKSSARLDGPVQSAHRELLGHLGRERRQSLTDLLALCRNETV